MTTYNQPVPTPSKLGDKWAGIANILQMKIDQLTESPAVLVAQGAFGWFLWIGINLTGEDIHTTVEGYNSLPTQAAFADTGNYIAWLLWLMPVTMTIYFQVTNNDKLLKLAVLSMGVDVIFDMIFRVQTPITSETWMQWGYEFAIAALQSVFIFSLGSEFAVAVGFTMSLALLPYSLNQLFVMASKLLAMAGKSIAAVDRGANWMKEFVEGGGSDFFKPRVPGAGKPGTPPEGYRPAPPQEKRPHTR